MISESDTWMLERFSLVSCCKATFQLIVILLFSTVLLMICSFKFLFSPLSVWSESDKETFKNSIAFTQKRLNSSQIKRRVVRVVRKIACLTASIFMWIETDLMMGKNSSNVLSAAVSNEPVKDNAVPLYATVMPSSTRKARWVETNLYLRLLSWMNDFVPILYEQEWTMFELWQRNNQNVWNA